MHSGVAIALLLVFPLLHARNVDTDGTYRAAAVEFNPTVSFDLNITKEGAVSIMMANLDQYERFMKEATTSSVQVIVFPEDGLYGAYFPTRNSVYNYLENIPNEMGIIPCDDPTFVDRPILQRASCLAKDYALLMVLDMGDIQPCNFFNDSNCPLDGRYQFNTQVAFGEDGQLLAKYHKSHLYEEPQFDEPITPTPATFTSSFGVTFGLLICFDIMWPHPQVDLYNMGVQNIIFSSWWVNFPPLITATQVQEATSRYGSINLIAANSGENVWTSGSGIYSSGNILASFFNSNYEGNSTMLIADVPKVPPVKSKFKQQRVEADAMLTRESEKLQFWTRSNFVAESVAMANETDRQVFFATPGAQVITANISNVTCVANFSISENSPNVGEYFALIAYQGPYSVLQIQTCALLRCPNATTCLQFELNSRSTFSYLHLEGTFGTNFRPLGLVAKNDGQLYDSSAYNLSYSDDGNKVNLSSARELEDLLNASLFVIL